MALYDYEGNELIIPIAAGMADPFENDIPVVSLYGELPTTKKQGEYPVKIIYKSSLESFDEYATVKVQGDSSQRYPKKNYTIKLYKDAAKTKKDKRLFRNWDKARSKFVMKANWIDHSHARNIVNARIWGNIVSSRSDYSSLPSQLLNGNLAVDGFPIKVYNNGIYLGLYTFNLPKDAMYGLDDKVDENCIVQSEGDVDDLSLMFRTSTMNNKWADELHDEMPTVIADSWTNFLRFNNESSDSVFYNNLSDYMDVTSLIDEHIYIQAGCMVDNLGKNQTFFTYDAQKWYTGMYDMDGTWGLPAFMPEERPWLSPETPFQTGYNAYKAVNVSNKLHDHLTNLFMDAIVSRYNDLRNGPLSEDGILIEYERFMQNIPPYLYDEDYAETTGNGNFTGIPLAATNNIHQIRNFVIQRMAYLDQNIQ